MVVIPTRSQFSSSVQDTALHVANTDFAPWLKFLPLTSASTFKMHVFKELGEKMRMSQLEKNQMKVTASCPYVRGSNFNLPT